MKQEPLTLVATCFIPNEFGLVREAKMIKTMAEQYGSFLRDESRLIGQAEDISFPKSVEEAQSIVKQCRAAQKPITVQGSRTGICGGAVPERGHIMNFSEMNQPVNISVDASGSFNLTVQPGYLLSSLRSDLASRRCQWLNPAGVDQGALLAFTEAPQHFWPPDPSETTASIGGLVATNGRGPGALKYGSVGNHISSLKVLMSDGQVREFSREKSQPLAPFVGGEGQYGALVEIGLRLSPKPMEIWGICFFFASENKAAAFIDQTRGSGLGTLVAIDFLDEQSLTMVEDLKKVAAKLKGLPDVPEGSRAAVYIELHGAGEEDIEVAASYLMGRAEECGGDPDASWALSGDEVEKLRLFRHAVPEAVNTRLDQIRQKFPGVVKMGGDMTMPGITFMECLSAYRQDLEGSLMAVVFGHSLHNHLHVNLLPTNEKERRAAETLMNKWLVRSRELGGDLFREHGVGKVKSGLFLHNERPEQIKLKRELKKTWDPEGLWNPGNTLGK